MTGKVLAALALAGLAAACNGGGYGSSKNDSTHSTPSATGTQVQVTETEYSIALSRTTFSPGVYTFVVHDAGHATHALEIDGPGVANQKSSLVQGGDTTMLTVTLSAGSYRLFCPVANHADKGMDTTITVA